MPAWARPAGRLRNPPLDSAILTAAGQQLGELGYARMSLESVAAAAGTTVPSVRRRFGSKAALAEAVIRSLRVAELPAQAGPPRARALAILENFRRNLLTEDAMAVLGTLLAEERHHPELLEIFRTRLAGPRPAWSQPPASNPCRTSSGTAQRPGPARRVRKISSSSG